MSTPSTAKNVRVALYGRVSTVGHGLAHGYSPLNHPRDAFNDGNAYFAGPQSRSLAEAYSRHGPYEDGVLEVRIPKADFDTHFSPLERLYQGGPDTETPVPYEMFDLLNSYPRYFHPAGG